MEKQKPIFYKYSTYGFFVNARNDLNCSSCNILIKKEQRFHIIKQNYKFVKYCLSCAQKRMVQRVCEIKQCDAPKLIVDNYKTALEGHNKELNAVTDT